MKIETHTSLNQFVVTELPNCKILRNIYRLDHLNGRFLLRIYEFKSKTIVIASQLIGAIRWDDLLLRQVINKFKLNWKNLIWINHVGPFSDIQLGEEKFIQTILAWEKEFIFSPQKCELVKEEKISLEVVEKLIEADLEPVEHWLVLDYDIYKEREAKHQEKKQQLLRLYLIKNLDFLTQQEQIRKLLPQAFLGAIFFYPEKRIKFLPYADLENSSDELERLALPYIRKYHPHNEMVVCVYEGSYSYCTILSKKFFLESLSFSESLSSSNNQTLPENLINTWQIYRQEEKSLNIVADLIGIELELAETKGEFKLDFSQQNELRNQNELKKLLQIYLQPQLDSLLLEFEQQMSFYQSEEEFNQPVRGAIFSYPGNESGYFLPLEYFGMEENLARPYVTKYNVETEVVTCLCLDEGQSKSICGIFPKNLP